MPKLIAPAPSPFTSQDQAKKAFLHELTTKRHPPQAPLIAYDLYGIAPLTAFVGFVTDLETDLLVTVHGKTPAGDLSYPLAGKDRVQMVPIIGLYPHGETQVTIQLAAETLALTLQAPGDLPVVPAYDRQAPGPDQALHFFLPADGRHAPCAFDAQGDLRWVTTLDLSHRLHLSREGFLLCGGTHNLAPPKGPTNLLWMDLTGRLVKRLQRPGGFTGDFLELPDRTLVAIGSSPERGTVADRLLWIDGRTGEEKRNIDLKSLARPWPPGPGQSGSDWFGADSLTYDEEGHRLVVSGLRQGEVLILDAATGRLLQAFPAEGEGPLQGPVGARMDQDRLILLENRRYQDGRARLSQIDGVSGERKVLWQAPEVSPVFNAWAPIGPDQALLHLGGGGDLSPDQAQKAPSAFSLYQHPETSLWSRRFEVSQGQARPLDRFGTAAIHSLDLPLAKARFARPDSPGLDLGSWGQALPVDIEMATHDHDQADSDMVQALWADDQRLFFQGAFYQGDVVLLVLRQGDQSRSYYIQTNRWPHGSDWLKSITDDVLRQVIWAIPLEGLEGTWDIDVWVDEVLYATSFAISL